VITTGQLSVDMSERTITIDGNPVYLRRKELGVLELLAQRIVRNQDHLYGRIDEPELKIIVVLFCKLRKKLANAFCDENYITTVWDRGYVQRNLESEQDAS
jgi:DNA-binding response OmpR family regulator